VDVLATLSVRVKSYADDTNILTNTWDVFKFRYAWKNSGFDMALFVYTLAQGEQAGGAGYEDTAVLISQDYCRMYYSCGTDGWVTMYSSGIYEIRRRSWLYDGPEYVETTTVLDTVKLVISAVWLNSAAWFGNAVYYYQSKTIYTAGGDFDVELNASYNALFTTNSALYMDVAGTTRQVTQEEYDAET
jgi:hypothetical protein